MSIFFWGFSFLIAGVGSTLFFVGLPLFMRTPKNEPTIIWMIGLLLGVITFLLAVYFLSAVPSYSQFNQTLPFFKSVPLFLAPMLYTSYFFLPLFLRSTRTKVWNFKLFFITLPVIFQLVLVGFFSTGRLDFVDFALIQSGLLLSLQLALGFLIIVAWLYYEASIKGRERPNFLLKFVQILSGFLSLVTFSWILFLLFDYANDQLISESLGGLLKLDINNRIIRMGSYCIFQILLTAYWVQTYSIRAIEERHKQAKIQELLAEKDVLITNLANSNSLIETGALSAGLAHELNQFLARIHFNSDEAIYQLDQPDINVSEINRNLQNVLEANQSAARLITSLRNLFSQSEPKAAPYEFDRLIEEVVALYSDRMRKSNIDIEMDLQGPGARMLFDTLMRQVVANLLSNAIDSLDTILNDEKKIVIRSRVVKDGQYELHFLDNGPGVHPDRVDKLFNLFSTSKTFGAGIGLWLSRYIVERHHGKLYYESSPSQAGACFVVSLPKS